jgi:hypothetical protein
MQEDRPTKSGFAERDGLMYPEWQVPLQNLILEVDGAQLHEKMQRVEALIYDRLQQLQARSDFHVAEREALNDAISVLRMLKRDKLNFPDWK